MTRYTLEGHASSGLPPPAEPYLLVLPCSDNAIRACTFRWPPYLAPPTSSASDTMMDAEEISIFSQSSYCHLQLLPVTPIHPLQLFHSTLSTFTSSQPSFSAIRYPVCRACILRSPQPRLNLPFPLDLRWIKRQNARSNQSTSLKY